MLLLGKQLLIGHRSGEVQQKKRKPRMQKDTPTEMPVSMVCFIHS
jgi:hypothetical protein